MNTTKPIPPPTEVPPSADPAHGGLPKRTVGGSNFIDMTGQRYGRLLVLSRAPNKRPKVARWLVLCDCGNKFEVIGSSLRTGNTKSCGCLRCSQNSARTLVNLTGKVFGRLTVLSRAANRPGLRHTQWNVRCLCGTEKIVQGTALRSGLVKSCGCLNTEQKGENSPTWNPNLTEEDRARRRLGTPTNETGALLSQRIRRRDRATCLVCGAPNSTHVHHLEPWALNRGLRYNPANLVTLCKECHEQFHRLYGNDAGLDEFEEFLC